jgi:hypothetical protein
MVQPNAVDRPTAKPAQQRHFGDFGQHLGMRLAQVPEAVRFRHRERDRHGMDAGRHRALGALGVGHQRDDTQARDGAGESDQLGGVRHLRQQGWRHEAADLDLAHARRSLRRDPRLLCGERHDPLRRLQPVARADFGDENAGHARFSR